ncbi:twin-arginine translocation pathway signal [Bradyrhizobium sp.]|uniref:twin-arginine translocation pathway signal n=1 Tax=Bradyrhizobium sp. TaxID=376 RepID=UPI0025C1602A|nr:twin-arginine translocation pathway signal [Bradyrhizobium sp.]
MTDLTRHISPLPFAAAVALLVCAAGLGGCAGMSDGVSTAFADPAKYQLYECKQLETERKTLAARTAELQGLMAKAETGAGGAVVAELAYRNEYVAVRGQSRFAEEAWQKNRCENAPPPAAAPVPPVIAPAPDARGARAVKR